VGKHRATSTEAFFDLLGSLHAYAGAPSLRVIAKGAKCSHDTVAKTLKGPRLPSAEAAHKVVTALWDIAEKELEVSPPPEYDWHTVHAAWVRAMTDERQTPGAPVGESAPAATDASAIDASASAPREQAPEASDPWTRSIVNDIFESGAAESKAWSSFASAFTQVAVRRLFGIGHNHPEFDRLMAMYITRRLQGDPDSFRVIQLPGVLSQDLEEGELIEILVSVLRVALGLDRSHLRLPLPRPSTSWERYKVTDARIHLAPPPLDAGQA